MTDAQDAGQDIVPREIEHEMRESYLNYAMSVIVGRALPDARDGLKPVHRRILHAMNEGGMHHNKAYKKSARIVGDVLGKYHPHGDSAIYDALVRMAQDFSMRYPLIQGQGNFGSIDGDNAAAMRYTEARLTKLAEELLADIDKDTVAFVDNFDGSLQEPTVLPSKIPNLLLNGSSGIAVGMATNIPPHQLGELVDATVALIEQPEISVAEIMTKIPGPDFPTGGTICGRNGILQAYTTGRGRVVVRAQYEIEQKRIIVTEIPYMVNKAELIKQIAELAKEKKIVDISDIRDESDRDGMRIVIELKQGANGEVVMNHLLKQTRLQTTFGINLLALTNGRPRTLGIKDALEHFLGHRKEVVKRRTQYELTKAKERAHILKGIIKALDDVDRAVAIIRKSKAIADARSGLMDTFSITEIQANAILDLKLQRLASLEQDKIRTEHKGLLERITELEAILASEQRVLDIIKEELLRIKADFNDERRTRISDEEMVELDMADLVEEEDVAITITARGYIKRQSLGSYRSQRRGGVGIIAATSREEDSVAEIFIANTHSTLLFFTDKGRAHQLKGYDIPDGSRTSQGKAIVNLLSLQPDEKVTAAIAVKEFTEGINLVMAMSSGTIKKTPLSAFSRPRRGGIIAVSLADDDRLIDVRMTDGTRNLLLATSHGKAIKFAESDVRTMGRGAAGVRGIRLAKGDSVIGMNIANDAKSLLSVCANGYGKRTKISDYRLIGRGGKGVINIIVSERNGPVVSVVSVTDQDEIMAITTSGIAMRTSVSGISVIGRNTQGVRVMKLREGDRIASVTRIQ